MAPIIFGDCINKKMVLFSIIFLTMLTRGVSAININACGQALSTTNAVYNVVNNIQSSTSTCLQINALNVTLDCNGYTIDGLNGGNGYIGVSITSNNVTVRRCVITRFDYGIYSNANLGIISNNTIINSNQEGIYLDHNSNNTIKNNKISNSVLDGIGLYMSTSNLIYNNLLNNTLNVFFGQLSGLNYWNTTRQNGTRIYSPGTQIGGNYWTNSTNNDYSDTCSDFDRDGFCNNPYTLSVNEIDYLPLSKKWLNPVCTDNIWEYGEWCGHDCLIAVNSTDMNHDCVVDVLDQILINKLFGSISSPSGDLNEDGLVDIKDLAIFSKHYGDFIANCTDAGQYLIDKKGNLSISFSNDAYNIINSTNVAVNSTLNVYVIASDVQNLTSLEFGLSSSPNLSFLGFSASPGLIFSGNESRIEIMASGSQQVTGPAVIGWATYSVKGNGNINIIKNSYFGKLDWSKPPENLYRADFANIFNGSATVSTPSPIIAISSPTNSTSYYKAYVPLNFTINEPTSWIGYSLNNMPNVTIPGPINMTNSTGYFINGWNNVIVYANDTSGNMGSSNRIIFNYCKGDTTGDRRINVLDLIRVAGRLNARCGDANYDAAVDLNDDCVINVLDLIVVSSNLNANCP